MDSRLNANGYVNDGEEGRATGETVAPKSQEIRLRRLRWFNPFKGAGRRFLWDDGIHAVKKVEMTNFGIGYVLGCGVMFTFEVIGDDVMEADIRLPPVTCEKCLK